VLLVLVLLVLVLLLLLLLLLTRPSQATGKMLLPELFCDIPEARLAQTKISSEILGMQAVKDLPFIEGAQVHKDYLRIT